MPKRLTQNVNSAYIEAANRLRPSSARRRIVAYVESYDDVAFWRSILDDFETPELYFEVKLPPRASALHYMISYYYINGKEYKR